MTTSAVVSVMPARISRHEKHAEWRQMIGISSCDAFSGFPVDYHCVGRDAGPEGRDEHATDSYRQRRRQWSRSCRRSASKRAAPIK